MREVIQVFAEFKENISQGLDKATDKLEKFTDKASTVTEAFAPISLAAAGAIGASLKFGSDWQSATGNAARGLDLAGKELEDFKKGAEGLSQKLNFQQSSAEILNLATDIGKLGVAKNDVLAYTEAITKLAVATDSADKIEDLSTNVAKIGNVFQFTSKDVMEFGGALNKLADATAATPNDIVNVTQRLSGIGKQSKLSASQVAAWGATLISAGKDASTTATFMNSFLGVLGAGSNLSKDAKTGLKALGLEATSLAKAFDKDANATMLTFLERVNKLDSVAQREVLGKIFGKEFSDDAALLSTQTKQLADNLKAAGDTQGNIAKINQEFEAMSKSGLGAQLTALKNIAFEIGKVIGEAIIPPLLQMAEAIKPIALGTAALFKQFPILAQISVILLGLVASVVPIAMIASSFMGLATVVPAVATAFTGLGTGLIGSVIPAFMTFLTTVIPGLLAGFGSLAVAVWTALAPLLPFIAAIAAVAGAAYLIWKNWEPIKGFFIGLWNNLLGAAQNFFNWLKSVPQQVLTALANFIINNFGIYTYFNLLRIMENLENIFIKLVTFIGNKLNEFKTFVGNIFNWIGTQLNNFFTMIGGILSKIGSFIAAKLGEVLNFITSNVQKLVSYLKTLLSPIATIVYDVFNKAYQTVASWGTMVGKAVSSIVDYVKNILINLGKSAWEWGNNLIGNFVKGIKDNIGRATNAVADMTQQVNDYMPHSPSKEGAFKNLDKTGFAFTDTFLKGLKASGITNFMGTALKPQTNLGLSTPTPRNQNTSNFQVVYSPVINGSKNDADMLMNMLKSKDRDLLDLIERTAKRLNRKFY